ncbi:GNAT family N-acetyltransferase [Arthrobacter zhaoxinii]|uniref:GNAT family N-acetyltransferase n=1 Tax=Arthrobacter zhaoxinii TaxID=2964616 RepID=A0ABY5YQF4_9MICC|nr:GNAT family N-acetyltransferase [Arthrobacter zhaoxinii]UWX97315.1 GNAT family N-acetyltransferase [Arthrobacter zhaoxinii]
MSIIPESLAADAGIPTERLSLDLMTVAEVDALIIQTRGPDWSEDFPQPADYDAARRAFEAGLLTPAAAAFGMRLIHECSTSLVVGTIGFDGVPLENAVEVTYNVVPSRRGQGYAAEALIALTRFILDQPGVDEVTAYTEPANEASQSVLLTAGFLPEEGSTMVLRFSLRRDQLPEASR